MIARRSSWSTWVNCLRRWHLADLAAWLLEAGGPLKLLGAQALYFGSIFLPFRSSSGAWDALIALLEDETESRDFVLYLLGKEVDL